MHMLLYTMGLSARQVGVHFQRSNDDSTPTVRLQSSCCSVSTSVPISSIPSHSPGGRRRTIYGHEPI